jgi:Cu/Ag efflux protein CusF
MNEGRAAVTQKIWRVPALAAAATLLLGGTALAVWEYGRGSIVSTNWGRMEMNVRDTQGRMVTWKVARNCEVKFEDQTEKFPNPKLSDLKAPMYVHYTFEQMDGTNTIIAVIVKEVGFDAAKGGPGIEQEAVVTSLDVNIGHIEVVLEPAGRTTFEVDPKGELVGIQKGDRVKILIDKRDGREVVTKVTKVGGGPQPQ